MRYGVQWPWNAARDSALVDAVQTYWINFARTGNPNGAGLPDWPAFASDTRLMDLGDEPKAVVWPEAKEHALLDAYMSSLRTMPKPAPD